MSHVFLLYWSGVARNLQPKTKRRGDRGSPCLTPLLHWNLFPSFPLRRTEEVVVERMFLIHVIHLFPKLIASWIVVIALCSTLSNAFSKSSFTMTTFLDWWQRCIYSKAQARQSWMVLVLINPYWFLWIKGIMILCNLLARIFVSSFMQVFKSEIGL